MGDKRQPASVGTRFLLLCRCDTPHGDQIYVERGLSIGRAEDNTFQLDDQAVCRHHAQVEFDTDHNLVLRCIDPGAQLLSASGQWVRELPLVPGTRFRVGPGEFECRPGTMNDVGDWPAECPFCKSRALPPPDPLPQSCPTCRASILVFRTEAASSAACIPAKVKDVALLRLIGVGGMGVVFEGRLESERRQVAVKVFHPHLAMDNIAWQCSRRQLDLLRKAEHHHVVEIVGYGLWRGQFIWMTEWLSGGSLADVVAAQQHGGTPPDFSEILRWLRQACLGLSAIHSVGLVHCNIKPSNLLLTAHRTLKIADIDVSRLVQGENSTLRHMGVVTASPSYMAPEQWDHPEEVDGRADLYALGVSFYELLTGDLPSRVQRPVSAVHPEVPSWFDAVLQRLLAPEPRERFASARQVIAVLDQSWRAADQVPILQHAVPTKRAPFILATTTRRGPAAPRTESKWLMALVAVAILLGVTALVSVAIVLCIQAIIRSQRAAVSRHDSWTSPGEDYPDVSVSRLTQGDVDRLPYRRVRCLGPSTPAFPGILPLESPKIATGFMNGSKRAWNGWDGPKQVPRGNVPVAGRSVTTRGGRFHAGSAVRGLSNVAATRRDGSIPSIRSRAICEPYPLRAIILNPVDRCYASFGGYTSGDWQSTPLRDVEAHVAARKRLGGIRRGPYSLMRGKTDGVA